MMLFDSCQEAAKCPNSIPVSPILHPTVTPTQCAPSNSLLPIPISLGIFYIAQLLLWQRAAEVMAGSMLHRLTRQQIEGRRATEAFLWASLLSTYLQT